MQNLFLTPAFDLFEPIAKWLVIGAVAALILAGIILFFINKDAAKKYVKSALIVAFGFLLVIGVTLLIMQICKRYSAAYAEENYLNAQAIISYVLIPFCCLIGVMLISAIALGVVISKNKKQPVELTTNDENSDDAPVTPAKKKMSKVKLTSIILGAINLAMLIVCGVLLAIFYGKNYADDGYYNSPSASVNQLVLYLGAAGLIIVIVALAFILDRNKRPIDTKCLTMAGICVAMSFGLSYVKLFEMPQGGSITLASLLPLMIFSYAYGTKKGVLACLVYGVLQAVQDPFIIHPAQFLLDYPVAFTAIGLSGAFASVKRLEKLPQVKFVLGGIIASVTRFISHVLSGVFAFSAYAAGANPWIYSLAYNSFVFVDIAIVLVIGAIVFSSKSFNRELEKATLINQ